MLPSEKLAFVDRLLKKNEQADPHIVIHRDEVSLLVGAYMAQNGIVGIDVQARNDHAAFRVAPREQHFKLSEGN